MLNKVAEQSLSRFLAIGMAFTTVFLLTGSVTDPVNVTKLAAAGGLGFSVFLIAVAQGSKSLFESSKALLIVAGVFLMAMINSIVSSASPLSQNLYGTSGRNTAFIFYFTMTILMIGASLLRSAKSFNQLLFALLFAGTLNVLYCGWVIIFGDFIGWNNPYKTILGLFGNPNFVSAFLGMFIAAMVAYVFSKNTKMTTRVLGLVLSLAAFFEILSSRSIQGIGVTFIGLGIVGFYLIRSKTKSVLPSLGYVLVVGAVGLIGIMGALQKGPLASLIYKTSISLRGQYWEAGIRAGLERPFTGVGMDSFGDWYRRARDTQALVMPGPNTVTNAAHNVPFDVFAFGGWPLFSVYIAILLLSVIAIIKVTLRTKAYDGVFVTLTTAWVCYQLQSIISINQIGLAVWGWLFGGALIAYEIATRSKTESIGDLSTTPKGTKGKVIKNKQSESIFSSTLIAGIGAVIGLLIASPPYSADAKWRSAITSQNVQKVEEALVPRYLNPMNSYKYASAVQLFESSKLPDLALKYAKIGVEFNPNHFDSWKVLYFISKASPEDKALALANMKRLDPNNPNVLG